MSRANQLLSKSFFACFFSLFLSVTAFPQRYLADIDSSFFIKDTVRPLIKRFENIRISGYIQPQFQKAQSDGAPSYSGGNFSQYSSSRFMLRRARVKIDYILPSKLKYPKALFSFQIDATERGVIVRDMFLKLFETKSNLFSLTAGLFARPFGYEVNLSSTVRETPERGRMSQILMPSERDIGVMVSHEPQESKRDRSRFKLDIGFFNGQGLSGTTDFDSHKDLIGRIFFRPYFSKSNIEFSGGLSYLRGGWKNGTKYVYESGTASNGDKIFIIDSAVSNLGKSSPRHYYGADAQVKLKHGWGETEWRAEYWFGTQPGTSGSTSNPGTLPTSNGIPVPTYVRHYDGVFLLFLQNIINAKHQLMVKYDWYDPNIKVAKMELGKAGTNLTPADVKFTTLGMGYAFHINSQTKIILYYDLVKNESTQLAGFTTDLKDNILTCRIQFRF
ncbi:MAG: porin [Chitinophagaceae bacterium]|nr:porin [Chitinophagaceae bacterium]